MVPRCFMSSSSASQMSVLCGTTVLVPPGTRVQLSGGDILGSHRIDVEPSEAGPVLKVQLIPVLAGIRLRSADG